MKFIQGHNRTQINLFPVSLDQSLDPENEVRTIDWLLKCLKPDHNTNEFTVLYDKGYHTGSELKTAQYLGIETIVAIPEVPSTRQAPDHDYGTIKRSR